MKKGDKETLGKIKEAWEEVESGKCNRLDGEEFVKEMKGW